MSELRPPQIDTYNGWTIATVDCCLAETKTKDLIGVRLWFNDEGYYVMIGATAEVRYALAVYGRKATDVTKSWNQGWAAHTTSGADAAGYRTEDDNIYYIYGNRKRCIRAIEDMCDRTCAGLAKEGHTDERIAVVIMRTRIKEALKLHDPTWEDSIDSVQKENDAAAAKKVVQRVNRHLILADGTQVDDQGF
jgi:hypothetical protein